MNSTLLPQVLHSFTSLATALGIFTAVFNGILTIVIASTKSLQVLENTFLVSIVVVNFLVGFLDLFSIVVWNSNNNTQYHSLMVCTSYIVNTALFQVVVMTLDKYIRIIHPFLHMRMCSHRNVGLVTCLVHVTVVSSMSSMLFQPWCSTFTFISKSRYATRCSHILS